MKRVATMAAVATLAFGASAMAEGDFVTAIDVSGWAPGSAAAIDLGGGFKAEITGIGWDVTLTAPDDGSWLSDGVFDLPGDPTPENPDGTSIFVRPGAGVNNPGTQTFSSDGIIKLLDAGLPNIQLNSGVLNLSYSAGGFGTFVKEDSFIFVQYNIIPAPGALALVGLAGLVSRRRRA